MYPSDYGYASTDTSCRSNLNSSNCKNNNWLYVNYFWTMMPYIISNYGNNAFFIYTGEVGNNAVFVTGETFPVLFLKSEIKITGGIGISTDPYTID